ncbi:MAG: LamG-like jellyroll fold domain-containing protein [Victivallaceae bacterium]|jgi:hypothetical protein
MSRKTFLIFAGLLALNAAAASAEISDAQNIILKSGAYRVSINPGLRYTIRSVEFDNCRLGTPTGFYGTVMAPQSGKYIGSGHTEGGCEQVIKISFTADGKEINPAPGSTVDAAKITMYKLSQLDNLQFQIEITVSDDGIVEQKRFVALKDQPIQLLYIFQACWSNKTTQWLAETAAGKTLSGEFDGKFEGASRWHLQEDVKWAANYDAAAGKGLLMFFPEVIKGKSRKTAFWEVKKAYNKFYVMSDTPAAYPAGYKSPAYALILKGYSASAENWKSVVIDTVKAASLLKTTALNDENIAAPAVKNEKAAKSITDSICFELDMTKSLDQVIPRKTAGSTAVKTLLTDKPVFDFDTMAHTNLGLLTGQAGSSIQINSDKNLPAGSGTIEMAVKAFDWEWNDNSVHTLLESVGTTDAGTAKMYLYKYKTSGLALYLELFQTGKKVFLTCPVKDWEKQSWHHVAIVYTPETVTLYVDGVKCKSADFPEIKKWPATFTVGPATKSLGWSNGRTTIANVTIFDTALAPAEVKAIAKERLPNLKIQVSNEESAHIGSKTIAPPSPWFKTRPKIGMEALAPETVLPPWTPVTIENNTVGVWGRSYDFSGSSPLNSIESNAGHLLAAPLKLQIKVNGEEGMLTFESPAILQKNKGRVMLKRESGEFKGIKASIEYAVEYDGMMFCKLVILPSGKKIGKLTASIQYSKETAAFIHYVGAPTAYESQDLPKNSCSIKLDEKPGTIFRSGFKTNVWIGNNDRGLLWFAESEQYWWPKDRNDMIEAVRNPDGTVNLNLNLATAEIPYGGSKELVYEFGLMATPVKPMPAGWRGMTVTAQYDAFKGDLRGNYLIYWPNEWRYMSLDPEPTRALNVDKVKAKISKDMAEGRKIIPYWTRLHFETKDESKVNTDALAVQDKWAAEPGRPGGGAHQMYRASCNSEWADYMVWCVDEWAKIMGHIDGMYMDETQPIPNTSEASGGGYTDFKGVRRPTFEALGSRNMIKRITYNIWMRNNKELPWSIAHCSATHTVQNLSMYTAMLIGEQIYSGYFFNNPEYLPPENDKLYYYSYALPMDRVRAECYWKQWGAVMIWLPCLKNQKDIMTNPATTRDMLSRVMQADMLVWPLFCNPAEVMKTWKFRKEFGVADAEVQFTPYWENSRIVSDKQDVAAGYYRNGNKYLVLVSNLNRTAVETVISFKGIKADSVKNVETGSKIELNNNSVKLNIPRNDYIALGINY